MTPTLIKSDARSVYAIHEAGHTIVALLLDLPVYGCSIIPGANEPARTKLWSPFTELEIWKLAVMLHAGPEAEKQFTGSPDASGGASDYAYAREFLAATRQETDPETDDLMDRYAIMARAKCIVHEAWIHRVAHALLKEQRLTADRVRALRDEGI